VSHAAKGLDGFSPVRAPDTHRPSAGSVGAEQLGLVAGGFAPSGEPAPLPLFRPAALEAAADAGLGKPIAVLPLSWSLLSGALLAMVTALVVFLFLGSYSRKETASGIVKSVGGDVRVSVLMPGIVKNVFVREGQRVHAGQTLMTIDTIRSDLDGRPIDQASITSLDQEIANLQDRLQAVDGADALERSGGSSRVTALRDELAATEAQEASNRKRLTLARAAYAKLEPVAKKGFISAETMRRREEEIIMAEQAVQVSRGTQARLAGEISAAVVMVAQRPMSHAEGRGRLLDLIARAKRDREAAAGQRGFALKAPADGIVNALQVSRGQLVDSQRSPMIISNPAADITAEIFVPSRAIGFVEPGQRVRVRYDAFPYQRFGAGWGRVQAVSSTILRPQDVDSPIRVEEPVYRVVLSLDHREVGAYGQRHRIRTGFGLSADIVLDERSFGEWLLDPIIALKGRL